MLGFYYRIWVDCITRGKSQPANRHNWASGSMLFMSTAMTLNFALVMTLLQRHVLGYYFYKVNFPHLPKYASNVISFLLLYILPVVAINCLLIFRNKRYKKLMKKYPYYNGKLFISYFTVSLLIPFVLVVIGLIISLTKLKPEI